MKTTLVLLFVGLASAGVLSCELPALDWQPLVPNGADGWLVITTNTAPAACALDAQGFVHLRGKLNDTNPVNSSEVFQLPTGCRPAYAQDLAVGVWEISSGAYGVGRLIISTGGLATLNGAAGATMGYLYLDGVVFDSN